MVQMKELPHEVRPWKISAKEAIEEKLAAALLQLYLFSPWIASLPGLHAIAVLQVVPPLALPSVGAFALRASFNSENLIRTQQLSVLRGGSALSL